MERFLCLKILNFPLILQILNFKPILQIAILNLKLKTQVNPDLLYWHYAENRTTHGQPHQKQTKMCE